MRYFAGVDIGSTTSKCVIIDEECNALTFQIEDTQYDRNLSGEAVLQFALDKLRMTREDLTATCATGYGRRAFTFADKVMPEISCHGAGTAKLLPGAKTIIDIGGQDAKIIRLDSKGRVFKFEMNDKCAAGTGRFFEVLSRRLLNVSLDQLGEIALQSDDPCLISSTCTVFAESEVVSYLSQGCSQANVAMGMMFSVARRLYSLGSQTNMGFEEDIVLTGGAAKNRALQKALSDCIKKPICCIENPQMPAALGAAIFARSEFSN